MLKIEHLDKAFGDKKVLNDLCFEVRPGSVFGLVGINGAGKSTLLRIIAGVYKADSGIVSFHDLDTYKDHRVRKEIAFVSDEQYYPVGATIGTAKQLYQTMYDFDPAAYTKYLKIFGLDEKQTILNLSKGMKKRVSLLLALSIHPKLLLLDEAYDGLEPLARLQFKKILTGLIEDEEITVIISSHNLRELEDICDSYGILEDGKMLSYGDLLESKNVIGKYQLVFQDECLTKDDFKDLDLMYYEQEGRVYKLVIRGDHDEVKKKLSAMKPLLMDDLQVSFEEMFIYEMESRGEYV